MTAQAEQEQEIQGTGSRGAMTPAAGRSRPGPDGVIAELRAHLQQRDRERQALARADAVLYGSQRLEDIFEALFDVATEVLGADKAAVWTWDDSRAGWVTAAARGADPAQWTDALPADDWIVRATFESHGLAVSDAQADPRLPVPMRDVLRREAIGAFLNAPVQVGRETFGVFAVSYRQPRPIGDGEQRLLDDLARRAGLAIKNARVYAREAEHLRELEALYRADGALLGSLRLDDVLRTMVDVATDMLGADKTSILVWDEGHESLVPGAVRGFSPESVATMRHLVGQGITGLVAASGRPIVVEDAASDPRVAHHITDPEGIQSLLHVPIEVGGTVFGVFGVNYCRRRRFTGDEERLLLALAQRAALAIGNARLYTQAKERARELEVLYRADGDLHRSLRISEVLQTLVDLPVEIGQAEMVTLLLWDEHRRRFVVGGVRGLSGEILSETFTLAEMRMARSSQSDLVEVTNAKSDTRISDHLRRTTSREGVQAWLGSPIRIGGRLFGSFSFGYGHPHAFTERERRLLVSLSQRAALAIQNARLHQETEHRRLELEALYRADEALHRSLRLDDVLQALVDVATDLLSADKASVWVWNAERSELVVGAARGLSDLTVRTPLGPADLEVLHQPPDGRVSVVEDYATDSRVGPRLREISERERFRSSVTAVIRVAGEVFGLFALGFAEPRAIDEEEGRLLLALAQRAALAIENARLYEQAQQAAALEERQRLARELHDAVTQTLFSASLIAEVTPRLWERDPDEGRRRLDELRQLTRGALAEMRTLLLELRPAALTEAGLDVLLRQLGEAMASRSRLSVDVRSEGVARPLPAEVQVGLYRLAQEALNNVAKHARARHATVHVGWLPDAVRIEVEDDGCGFDPASVPPGHLGLGIMQERAASVGAMVEVASRPGGGTRVEVEWPDGRVTA